MAHNLPRKIAFGAGIALVAVAVGGGAALMNLSSVAAQAESGAVVPAAVQASVALVEAKATAPSDEFSGRLEAIERVEIRSASQAPSRRSTFAKARWSRRTTFWC